MGKFKAAFRIDTGRHLEKYHWVHRMGDVTQQLQQFLARQPHLGQGVFIAPGARVVGDVTLGEYSSVWYNAVLRADINRIVVGHHSNIQDGCVLHLADEFPCIIGSYVTIGHNATIHACIVEDESLVGMGASILDGAVIGPHCLVGARTLVTEQARIPPGSLVLGVPGRVVRQLTAEERTELKRIAEKYVKVAEAHRSRGADGRPIN